MIFLSAVMFSKALLRCSVSWQSRLMAEWSHDLHRMGQALVNQQELSPQLKLRALARGDPARQAPVPATSSDRLKAIRLDSKSSSARSVGSPSNLAMPSAFRKIPGRQCRRTGHVDDVDCRWTHWQDTGASSAWARNSSSSAAIQARIDEAEHALQDRRALQGKAERQIETGQHQHGQNTARRFDRPAPTWHLRPGNDKDAAGNVPANNNMARPSRPERDQPRLTPGIVSGAFQQIDDRLPGHSHAYQGRKKDNSPEEKTDKERCHQNPAPKPRRTGRQN